MKSKRFLDSRVGYLLLSAGMLLGVLTPALVPTFASAAQLTSRSMAMSSSASGATGVTYDLLFTAGTTITAGGGVAIEYCSNSPLIGDACTAPTGMTAASATLTDVKVAGTSLAANKGTIVGAANNVVWTAASSGTYSSGNTVEIILAGITNPTTANSNLYARITTYTNATNIAGFSGGATVGTYADSGAIATSVTNLIGVTASVLETMTFCVANQTITAGCGDASTGGHEPNLTLGHGSPLALDSTAVDTGNIYSQLSTNAVSGAIVKMTNSTGCGGLSRPGSGTCDIAPVGTTGVLNTALTNQSNGKFGLNVQTAVGVGSSFGTITPSATYGLAANTYAMDNTAVTGVSGTYGNQIYSSAGPTANMNTPMTFAAVSGLTTPAGTYKANLNLIATGTY